MKCYFTTKFIVCYLLGGSTPKSPAKTESETPKKKPEMWCNVGVFDTNTTIVSDYIASPETNEQVDLVTATLGGRRFQLEPGTAYKFRVCAVNGCGTGPWSDVAAFKTTLPGFPGIYFDFYPDFRDVPIKY